MLKKIGAIAIFILCLHNNLSAASSENLIITARRAAVNTITLSSGTLTTNITPSLFNQTGTDSESLGTIVVTATKESNQAFGVTITQTGIAYPATTGNSPTATQWALFRSASSSNFILLNIQSSVLTNSTTTFNTGVATIAKFSRTTTAANLTTATTSTYSTQQLTLTFSAQDGPGIDLTPGDYVGNFTIAIGAAIS